MSKFHLLRYLFAGEDSAIFINLDCVKTLYIYPRQNNDAPVNIVIQWREYSNTSYEITTEQLEKLLTAMQVAGAL